MPSVKKRLPSLLSRVTVQQLLYALLLISFFLIGYLIAKIQTLEAGSTTTTTMGDQNSPGKVTMGLGHLPPLGDKNAKVTIVEFSDFQCLFCRKYWKETFPQLKKEYIDTGKAVLYYRHYPLSFHPQAQISAEASECANEQGKFYQFHDKIFEEQVKQGEGTIEYTADDIKKWATEIGIDMKKFTPCFEESKYKDNVAQDFNDGSAAGVNGTPGFFINGTSLVGAQPFESFKAIIDEELKK